MKPKYLIAAFLVFTATNLHATTIDGSTLNTLSVLSSAGIGSTLVTTAEIGSLATGAGVAVAIGAGVAYYAQTGENPVYAAASTIASAADALFVPAYQAFKATFVSPESYPASAAQYVGKEVSVGATIGDIIDTVKNSSSSYAKLKDLISSNTSDSIYNKSDFTIGEIFPIGNTFYKILGPPNYPSPILKNVVLSSTHIKVGNAYGFIYQGLFYIADLSDMYDAFYCRATYYGVQVVTQDPTIEPVPGSVNYEGLKAAFSQANSDASLADDVRKAIAATPASAKITSAQSAPTTLPATSASPITNNDVSNFFTANTTNVYNEYLNTVNNGGDVNTAQAAAELAKAQEEEVDKETEEKFNALNANSFQQPYNPGPFDIPTRFTTFLQNVKSSGLFSFSSAFFDSLPGGGSPVYTVEAGNYGTHSIDLSDTMSTGLAVLKSILLACFGFLSIRAVIMKR